VLRELITRPIGMVAALLDLPRTLERSVREANALMEISRQQLDLMRRQADEALAQAERMNDLLARVVKLTEPLERAQRGGEYVGGRLKQMIFGEENPELQAERAEDAAVQAENAADDAETAAEDAEVATDQAEDAADGTTIRVIPNRPDPEGDDSEQ
jgi:hypothetical protein